MAGKVQAPALVVAGVHDNQVTPDRVRAVYDAIGATEKVLLDLGCASHNAMWERNRVLLFRASLDWLTTGALGEAFTEGLDHCHTRGADWPRRAPRRAVARFARNRAAQPLATSPVRRCARRVTLERVVGAWPGL